MTASPENVECGDNEKYCGRSKEGNLSGSYVKNREGCTNRKDSERI